MELSALCSEDEHDLAVCCCFCLFPLPLLCAAHVQKHSSDSEFLMHFHLPVYARELINSQDRKDSCKLWLFKLHSAHFALRRNDSDLARAEDLLEAQRQDLIAQIDSQHFHLRQRILELRSAFAALANAVVSETSFHALEEWKPEEGSLSELIWKYNVSQPDTLKVFRVTEQQAQLESGIALTVETNVKALKELEVHSENTAASQQKAGHRCSEAQELIERMKEEIDKLTLGNEHLKNRNGHLLTELEEIRAEKIADIRQLSEKLKAEKEKRVAQKKQLIDEQEAIQLQSSAEIASLRHALDSLRTTHESDLKRLFAEKATLSSDISAKTKQLSEQFKQVREENEAEIRRLRLEKQTAMSEATRELKRLSSLCSGRSPPAETPSTPTSNELKDFEPAITAEYPREPHCPSYAVIHRNFLRLFNLQTFQSTTFTLSISFFNHTSYCMMTGDLLLCVGAYPPSTTAYTVSLSTGAVTLLKPMAKARFFPGLIKYAYFVYLFGGSDGTRALTACEKFASSTETWHAVAPMHYQRESFSPCLFEKLIYLADVRQQHRVLEVFDAEKEEFKIDSVRLPISLSNQSVAFVADKEMVVVTKNKQMGKWRIGAEDGFRVEEVSVMDENSCFTIAPPIQVENAVFWTNWYTAKLVKFDLASQLLFEY